MFSNCVFQQHNCGTNQAQSVRAYMYATGIVLIELQAQIPDVSLIKNTWGLLKRQLRQRTTYPTYADNLFDALCEEWNLIPDSLYVYTSTFSLEVKRTIYKTLTEQ